MGESGSETVNCENLREEGNKHFKSADYKQALSCYTRAINLPTDKNGAAILYRNRAACYLKLEDYPSAEADASKAIEMDGGDVKALFRRSQALENLGRIDQALLDLQRCLTLEPKNKAFQEALRKLGVQAQEKVRLMATTDSKVDQMFKILLDTNEKDTEKQQKAAQNLVVLAREDAGAEKIFQSDGVRLLQRMMDTKKSDMILAALRTFAGLCAGHQSRTMAILHSVGMERFCSVMAVDDESISLAACSTIHAMFDALKEGMKKEFRGKEGAVVLDPSKELKSMTRYLLEMLTQAKVSSPGRENSLNLLIKIVPRKSLRDPDNGVTLWVIDQGLTKILEVGGSVVEIPGSLAVTDTTRMSASVLLNKLFDDLKSDAERENFYKLCEDYVRGWFEGRGMDGKLRAIQTVSCLLQGPSDAGNRTLELSGIMESIIALCASEREIDQQISVEALIHAAGKAKRASFITANGVTLLKDIYRKNENDAIRIRALVGLCKLGSAGGTDFSMKQFAEGSTLKLAKQCRKWLCNESIQPSTRRWAVEGLAYLTFDADVKEEFVEDKDALQAMFNLAKSQDKTVLFAVASTLVNCTNSYDREEIDPQMLELAKYAKQHIPEEHPKDKKEFVEARVGKLLVAGVVSALTCMVKNETPALTESSRELISRVFLALVEKAEDRGNVVAQGGGKALIPLALEGTDIGKTKASQALAKITITSNPEIAFPGERVQNLFMAEGSDRLKLIVLYSGEDDEQLRRAASGTLALLTSLQPDICRRVPQVTGHWLEILQALLLSENLELQHRGAVVVLNMMEADKEVAEKLMESEMFEILTVLANKEGEKSKAAARAAKSCLSKAVEYGLIRPNMSAESK
uniref:Unc-45 myosin chaperone A n=1 Tax=Leptobrachium leishanense TaxID=445787 RepID=A0A8C5M398_9ANUR